MTTTFKPRFKIGTLVATPAFVKKVDPSYGMAALVQHLQGKWGMVDAEDAVTNDNALKYGGRLLSAYPLPDDAGDFWIITEADRSVTTNTSTVELLVPFRAVVKVMLLPSDY